MLVELAIGDAYGLPFEFVNDVNFINTHNNLEYHEHPTRFHENIKAGHYTDDTQMTIAVINHLLLAKNLPGQCTQSSLMRKFIEAHRQDVRQGYGKRLTVALSHAIKENSDNEVDTFVKYLGENVSSANGCVMRTLPYGLLPDADQVVRYAIMNASTTHMTFSATKATCVASLISHYLYHEMGPLTRLHLQTFIAHHMHEIFMFRDADDTKRVECDALETVRAVLYLITSEKSQSAILRKAIALRGDTDSVAAVSMGLSSFSKEIEQDIPRNLYDNLENGLFGKDYLVALERLLFEAYPKNPTLKSFYK
jgi:ADP-ribosyl-[dinitrogen reductase] hydrolase